MAALSCWGQQSPPPEVDKALRSRITKFYQAHVDGKFRQAEQYIAEENRDDFYNAAKTSYLSFTESEIQYGEDFTKAIVHTPTMMLWKVPQLGEMKLRKIVESYWKLVDGQWYWYHDASNAGMIVPFGPDGKPVRMVPGPYDTAEKKDESITDKINNFDRSALRKVEISQTQVHLNKRGGTSEEVVVKNNMTGVIVVQIDHSDLPGLDVKVSQPELKPGESGKIVFTYQPPKPEDKPQLNASIRIPATLQEFPLSVVFTDPPPEAPKAAAPTPAPAGKKKKKK